MVKVMTSKGFSTVFAIFVSSPLLLSGVSGHGRLIEPPSRSTMWRYGFSTNPNYNDHELYCGGFTRQWVVNGGKCGICGDPWDSKQPRDNEAGGRYAKGVIVRKYQKGQTITVRVELTANHMGSFEFRICPNNDPTNAASQMCLDQNLLQKSNGGGPSYKVGPGNKIFEMHYQLPKDLTCHQCVFQWKYIAGNNWGTCRNGTGAVGCGPQEEFRACADVAIVEADGTANNKINDLFDPEVFVTPNNDEHNEISYTEGKEEPYHETKDSKDNVVIVNVIVIVLTSLIVVSVFFTGVYFYYMKGGKTSVDKLREQHKSKMPKRPTAATKLPSKHLNWSTVVDKENNFLLNNRLTKLLVKGNEKKKVSPAVANAAASHHGNSKSQGETNAAPKPPPRARKSPESSQMQAGGVAPRLATITPRGSSFAIRPQVPPPSVPSANASVQGLEISTPTAVTINGVSVATSDKQPVVTVPAHLAMAGDDIPDSYLQQPFPPPLPNCPPPDDLDDVNLSKGSAVCS